MEAARVCGQCVKFLLLVALVFADKCFFHNVHILTWNVNEKEPPPDIDRLLAIESYESDIYAIGLQEVSPLLGIWNKNEEKWLNAFSAHFTARKYRELARVSIKGSLLTVFATPNVANRVGSRETSSLKRGLFGLTGNKGATSFRFDLEGYSFCFVNSHLAAHQEYEARRIEDIKAINANLAFYNPSTPHIEDHDIVFWFGDLNFRIDDVLQVEIMQTLIDSETPKEIADKLLPMDQLKKAIASGQAFAGYTEENPEFYPTFKFVVGSQRYNWKRNPAWTDRILYKIQRPDLIEARRKAYNSVMRYTMSDHKPVYANIEIFISNEAPLVTNNGSTFS